MEIDVELPDDQGTWSPIEPGTTLEIRGTIVDRHDARPRLPTAEEIQAGSPAPTEADIQAARTHYVLTEVVLHPLRAPEQVHAELASHVGETVELPGVLLSKNDHWWLDHDSLDLHLENLEAIEGWGEHELLGNMMVVVGRLDRRPMPRLDQIGHETERDLADAFVVRVERTKPYPVHPIEPCPRG